jgi:hypothetical protein
MMLSTLKGNGCFVFSDPGGAKAVLSFVTSLLPRLTTYKIISDRQYNFYNDFSVIVNKPQLSAREELKIFSPSFLFTGTSYTSAIELEYISAAKELAIPSLAFVDHWTSIRERFNNTCGEVFPDKILVIDERAKSIAMEQGIIENKIEIAGNPYHVYLKEWKPALSKQEFLQTLNLPVAGKKIAVYAPEPLSNINGFSVYGFDEITATDQLRQAVKELRDEYCFIFNPHPNQNMQSIIPVLGKDIMTAPGGINVNTLIYYSDVVIGFFSNFLIEAVVMNKPVLRYFIRKGLKDPFENMEIGRVVYPETIVSALKTM